MKLLDLKYLLVKDGEHVKAFASLMPTYEDGLRVIYCYEIHLATELQGYVSFFLLLSVWVLLCDAFWKSG